MWGGASRAGLCEIIYHLPRARVGYGIACDFAGMKRERIEAGAWFDSRIRVFAGATGLIILLVSEI